MTIQYTVLGFEHTTMSLITQPLEQGSRPIKYNGFFVG